MDTGRYRSVSRLLAEQGRPIRYGYVRKPWPLSYYQTVFARVPGSAEMPSAARPFTAEVVTRLVAAGVQFVPIVLHTGVASPEAHERPYPEWFSVPEVDRAASSTRQNRPAAGSSAVGTTAVRALEIATDERARARAVRLDRPDDHARARGSGGRRSAHRVPRAARPRTWTCSPRSPRRPARPLLRRGDRGGYLWHEFGDVNLLLP